ncbi:hypothetical protein LGN17_20470 [Burkholderia sp. AU30280]|uniref:hypothetical protein n=1 Tax=Burkholderia sp. AU30280 TaxID=2879628 RepID=UPI001CF43848|nr:hypothetical protein [Burkholderia sp. AU30280]MCA8274865.1 hypothetical protein [Burkholderia sp. AU30280]
MGQRPRIHSNRRPATAFVIRTSRFAKSTQPKNPSESPRETERFFDVVSKKHGIVTFHARAIPTSEIGDDEAGPRSTRATTRPGNTGRHGKPVARPVQPPAKYADLFTERQRNRVALCRCEKPYQEHKSSSKFV